MIINKLFYFIILNILHLYFQLASVGLHKYPTLMETIEISPNYYNIYDAQNHVIQTASYLPKLKMYNLKFLKITKFSVC